MSRTPNYFRFLTESAESTDCPAEIECLNGTKYCWIYEILEDVNEKLDALKRGSCTPNDLVKNQMVMYEIIIVIICILEGCCDPDPPPSESSSSEPPPQQNYNCDTSGNCFPDDNGPYGSIEECQSAVASGECYEGPNLPWLCDQTTGKCIQHTSGTYATKEECEAAGCTTEVPEDRWACIPHTGECVKTENGPYTTYQDCVDGCVEQKRYRCDRASGSCIEDPNGEYATADDCLAAILRGDCEKDPDGAFTYDCAGTPTNDPWCYAVRGDAGRWETMEECEANKDLPISKGGCREDEDGGEIPCCPQFPGNVLTARITYGKKGSECVVEHPIRYVDPGPGQKRHCWVPDRINECELMKCDPHPDCCFCPQSDWIFVFPDCEAHQTYLAATLCCEFDPNTGQYYWVLSADMSCRPENQPCDLPPTTVAAFAKTPNGTCSPMDAEASGLLCTAGTGLGMDPDPHCCPVKVEVFSRDKAAMLDLNGETLVDSNGLVLDEGYGVSDITEGADNDILLDTGGSPLIELGGPIGLEDSDGTHLFDSGLPTQFPLLEG